MFITSLFVYRNNVRAVRLMHKAGERLCCSTQWNVVEDYKVLPATNFESTALIGRNLDSRPLKVFAAETMVQVSLQP